MGVALGRAVIVLTAAAGMLAAAPQLRLSTTALGPVSVATGANGPTMSVEATNAGDGALQLRATSSVPWLVPSVGTAGNCGLRGACTPINIALQTSSLARGTHTGMITIADPNAIDAPQTITVTVNAGGGVPERLDVFLPPGGSTETTFYAVPSTQVSAQGGSWLSVAAEGSGSFGFSRPYRIQLRHQPGMAEGSYNGTVTTSGSNIATENRSVPVSLRITSQPIATPAGTTLNLTVAQGTPKQQQFIVLSNTGSGTLAVSGATATTTTGGNWLTAAPVAGSTIVGVTADVTGLSAGAYSGSVNVSSNAANGAINVPVMLQVVAQAPPLANFQGVVNNATFRGGESLAPGDIVSLFGEQLAYGEGLRSAAGAPLPTEIEGTRVLVNDRAAPLYYVSYGQLAFQIPYDTPTGTATVRVERSGQRGNTVSVNVIGSAPRILMFAGTPYGIIVNQDGSYPRPGPNGRAARPGDALVIYAIGFGQTEPAAQTGVGVPSSPLSWVRPLPPVHFGGSLFDPGIPVEPLFVGLTPGFVGLYQVNVQVPEAAPRGQNVNLFVGSSNTVQLWIE